MPRFPIHIRRLVAMVLAVAVLLPGLFTTTAAAQEEITLTLATGEIRLALEGDASWETYTVATGHSRGLGLSGAGGYSASYVLDRGLAGALEAMTFPFEAAGSVLLRGELMAELEGKVLVKAFPARQAAAVIDPDSGALSLYGVNDSDSPTVYTLVIADDGGEGVDLSGASGSILRGAMEELGEEALSRRRQSAAGVEVLEVILPETSSAAARLGASTNPGLGMSGAEYLAVTGKRESASPRGEGESVTLTVPANSWGMLGTPVGLGDPVTVPHTVTLDPANGDTSWEETVADGGWLEEPDPTPVPPAGYTRFVAWYEESEPAGGDPYVFGSPVRSDLWLQARYTDAFLVEFTDALGEVIHTQEVSPGQRATPYDASPEELKAGDDDVFRYWYEKGTDPDHAFDFAGELTADLVLAPRFSGKYTVTFFSDGTQVAPIQVDAGQGIPPESQPGEPTRAGYTFLHWSDQREGGAYNFATPVERDLVLYAVWQVESVNYEIVYWLEKPDVTGDPGEDVDNYAFHSKATLQASTGASVQDLMDGINPKTIAYAEYRHRTASHTQVAGDGTTIIHLYYKRRVYSFTFDLNPDGTESTMQFKGDTYRQGGNSDTDKYGFTAKLGQDISGLWPSIDTAQFTRGSTQFYGWTMPNNYIYNAKGHTLTTELLPGSGTAFTFQASWLGSTVQHTYNTYLDLLIGETGNASHNSKSYKRSDQHSYTYYASSSGGTLPDEYHGLTVANDGQQNGQQTHWYYNRNQNPITFNLQGGGFPGGALPSPTGYTPGTSGYAGVKFGEALSYFKPTAEPTRTVDGVVYDFAGWYYDAYYAEEVNFAGDTMPGGALEIYAKWTPRESYTATFYDDTRSASPVDQTTFYADQYVALSTHYTPGQYVPGRGTFLGWQWHVGPVLLDFSPDTVVRRDLSLFAKWKFDDFTVTYHMGAGSGSPPVDDSLYQRGEEATVLPWAGTALGSQEFVGWKRDGDSALYLPGSRVAVDRDIVFTAQYENTVNLVTLKLHPNGGEGLVISHDLPQNSGITLPEADAFDRPGHTLIGWTLTSGGNAADYSLGQRIAVTGSTDLYAVWNADVYVVTFRASGSGRLVGNVRHEVSWGTVLTDLALPTAQPDQYHYFAGWDPEITGAPITGSMTITGTFAQQTALTVTAEDGIQIYNGTPLAAGGYRIEPNLPGIQVSGIIVPSVSITDVGSLPVTPDVGSTVVMEGIEDVTHKYRFIPVAGTLTVTPRLLTIQGESAVRTYEGGVITADTGGVLAEGELVSGHTLSVTARGTGTEVGDYPIQVTGYTVMAGSNDVTGNYAAAYREGTMTIGPRAITVQGESLVREYTGEEIAVETEGEVVSGSLAPGHVLEVTARGAGTVAGDYPVGVTGFAVKAGDAEVTGNYIITAVAGTLTIAPRAITIQGVSLVREYTGEEITVDAGGEVVSGSLVSGHTLTVTAEGKGTGAGDYPVGITGFAVMAGDVDVTASYHVTTLAGTLTVAPRAITVQGESLVRGYIGEEITVDAGGEVVSGSLAPGHNLTVEARGTGTEVGDYPISITGVTVKAGDVDVTASYAITAVDGVLTIQEEDAPDSEPGRVTSRGGDPGTSHSYGTGAKAAIPDSALSWDGAGTLVINHDGVTLLGLRRVLWDGVETEDYTAYAGSVIIRFDEDFLAAQAPGAHAVQVEFLNHTAEVVVTLGDAVVHAPDRWDNENHNPDTGGAASRR